MLASHLFGLSKTNQLIAAQVCDICSRRKRGVMHDVSKHFLYNVLVLFPAPSDADLKAKNSFK